MRLVTADEVRSIDRATIESGHATGLALMDRAGHQVVAAMERRYGPLLALRVLVLCGTGNNGGDGLVAARALGRLGAKVRAVVLGDPQRLRGDALQCLEAARAAGVVIERADDEAALDRQLAACDAWDFAVDAMLGTGARGAPEGVIAAGVQALRELDERGTRVVAVDLPTGVDADSGAIARRAVRADLTVAFGFPKRGHWLYPGRAFVGALEVAEIGLAPQIAQPGASRIEVATASELAMLLPTRSPDTHKKRAGRVLVIGGAPGLTGAPVLAARAAMRAGAGYVQLAAPSSLEDVLASRLVEPMTLAMPETPQRTLALAALEPLLEAAAAVDAVVLGCGLSRHSESSELVRRFVERCATPVLLDADGLNAFEAAREALHAESAAASPACGAPGRVRILTPHLGEMQRLTGESPAALESARIDGTVAWAKRWAAVLVLKGAPTVTASADGAATVNSTGGPVLASAGTGDVLAGITVALVAQGLAAYDAARLGVFLHGTAGDRLNTTRGALGVIASDVLEALPDVMRELARTREGRARGTA